MVSTYSRVLADFLDPRAAGYLRGASPGIWLAVAEVRRNMSHDQAVIIELINIGLTEYLTTQEIATLCDASSGVLDAVSGFSNPDGDWIYDY